MDSVRNRTEAQTVLALRRTNGILQSLLEDYSPFINFHERKEILSTIEKIEEQVLYESEESWLFRSLEIIKHAKQVFRAFELISLKMEWEELRICMILSEAQLIELETQIKLVLQTTTMP